MMKDRKRTDFLRAKYIGRLADAIKDGFTGCLIDEADELEVQRLFFSDDHYYFTEQCEDASLCLHCLKTVQI